jgi:hypothetical protein
VRSVELSTGNGRRPIRVDNELLELGESSVAELADGLRRAGIYERDDATGDPRAVSASARASEKLRDAIHSREPVTLDEEEFASVRAVIEHEARETRGGMDTLPGDLVELRHAIVDRRRAE